MKSMVSAVAVLVLLGAPVAAAEVESGGIY